MAEGKVYNFYKGSQNVEHIDKQVNKYYYGNGGDDVLTAEVLRKRLDAVMPFIKISRHWFGVCKVLMEYKEVGDGDFEGALVLIGGAYPEGIPHGPSAKDLSSLNVQSWRKEIDEWDEKDSPVTKGYSAYLTVALRFKAEIDNA